MEQRSARPIGNKVIAMKQRAFIEHVSALVPGRDILVQPLSEDPERQTKTEWVPLRDAPAGEVWTRGIALNEVVFDFDSKDWSLVRTTAGRVSAVLDQQGFAHQMALSGGKGVHIHVWLDFDALLVDEALLERARRVEVCPFSVARETFANAVLDAADAPKSPHRWAKDAKGGIFDLSKVKWTAQRRGSMIREYGCRGGRGFRKTLVDALPQDLPTEKDAPPLVMPTHPSALVRYPLPLLARFKRALREQVEAAEAALAATPKCLDAKDPMDVPCVRRTVEEGVGQGNRHYAHLNLVVTYYRMGRPAQEAEAALHKAVQKHGLSAGDTVQKLVWQVYSGRWRAPANLSCPSPAVAGLCNPNACALSRHLSFD